MTKSISTHLIVAFAKTSEWERIPLTQDQYNKTREAKSWSNFSKTHEIRDPNTKKLLFSDMISKITWFEEIELKKNFSRRFCDFWVWHTGNESCKCSSEFWITWLEYKDKIFQLWYSYVQDVSEKRRLEIIAEIKRDRHN